MAPAGASDEASAGTAQQGIGRTAQTGASGSASSVALASARSATSASAWLSKESAGTAQTGASDEAVAAQIAEEGHGTLEGRIGSMLEAHHQSIIEGIERLLQERGVGLDRQAGRDVGCRPAGEALVGSVDQDGSAGAKRTSGGRISRTGTGSVPLEVEEQQRALTEVKKSIVSGTRSVSSGESEALPRFWPFAVAGFVKDTREFEAVSALMIIANSCSVGFDADWSIKHPGMDLPDASRAVELCIVCVFCLEMLIRVLAERRMFYDTGNPCFGWNVLDTLIVVISFLNATGAMVNLSVVRALRLLRPVRMLRLIKVVRVFQFTACFRELRVMVGGILNCGRTLCWGLLLLWIVTYMYAAFCLQIFAEWLGSASDVLPPDDATQRTIDAINYHFPSLPWSAYTLFKASAGGVDWQSVVDPMDQVGAFMVLSFVLYVCVTVFCVLNVITAAFVDAASRDSVYGDASLVEQIDWKSEWVQRLVTLFQRHTEGSDTLDLTNFEKVVQDRRARSLFREMGLDLDFWRPKSLFHLFDIDHDGHVGVDEFIQGCCHLKGPAMSLDMYIGMCRLSRKVDRVLQSRPESQQAGGSRQTSKGTETNGELDVGLAGVFDRMLQSRPELQQAGDSRQTSKGETLPVGLADL